MTSSVQTQLTATVENCVCVCVAERAGGHPHQAVQWTTLLGAWSEGVSLVYQGFMFLFLLSGNRVIQII